MGLFKSIVKLVKHEDYGGRIAQYEDYIYPCKKCKKPTDISEVPPLSMEHCPHCNELFLVPMRIEDWWVCQPLGGGGMGAVYLGRHRENPELKAAVKVLQASEEINETFLTMLLEEAEIAACFGNHPLLAQVYSYGYNEDTCEVHMIMEFIEGERFDKTISTHEKGLNEELSMYFFLDILSGLEYIFQCGYLYRDLKPENLIVRENNHVTLVDYGLCMTINDAWYNESEDIMGSPLYMPPERIGGTGEDFRADLYALGMVIFHLLDGKPYFSETELMKIVKRQFGGLRLQTKFKLQRHHPKIIELIDTLIRVDREERYQDYQEIRNVVHEVLMDLHKKKTECKVTKKRRAEYIESCLAQTVNNS
jgi:eukaryotic-like serine/threonine-protein kinase